METPFKTVMEEEMNEYVENSFFPPTSWRKMQRLGYMWFQGVNISLQILNFCRIKLFQAVAACPETRNSPKEVFVMLNEN